MPLLQVWVHIPYSLLDAIMDNCQFCFKSVKQVYPTLKRHEMNLTLREVFAGTSKGTVPLTIAVLLPYLERQHLQWEVIVLIRAHTNTSDILLGSGRKPVQAGSCNIRTEGRLGIPCIPHWLPWLLLLTYPPKTPSCGCVYFSPQKSSNHTSQKDLSLKRQTWCYF